MNWIEGATLLVVQLMLSCFLPCHCWARRRAQAESAIEQLNGAVIRGRLIRVIHAGAGAGRDPFRQGFSRQYPRGPRGPRGQALQAADGAEGAEGTEGADADGNDTNLSCSNSRSTVDDGSSSSSSRRRRRLDFRPKRYAVYVGNLDWKVTEGASQRGLDAGREGESSI